MKETITAVSPNNLEAFLSVIKPMERPLFIAGCTDVLVNLGTHFDGYDGIVNLLDIQEMKGIRIEDSMLVIGASECFANISKNPLVKQYAFALHQAASIVGSPQIRNRATLGGNVANNAAAADTIPCLVAMKARLVIQLVNQELIDLSIDEYLNQHQGYKQHNALIIAVRIPIYEHNISRFIRVGSRSSVTISKLSLAIHAELSNQGMQQVGVALGAAGTMTRRIQMAEQALEGQDRARLEINRISEILVCDLDTHLKGRASLPYKRHVIVGLVNDLFDMK